MNRTDRRLARCRRMMHRAVRRLQEKEALHAVELARRDTVITKLRHILESKR